MENDKNWVETLEDILIFDFEGLTRENDAVASGLIIGAVLSLLVWGASKLRSK